MSRVAVVVPIKPGMYEAAKSLVESGPPFRLEDTPLEGHCVYLTEHEAVFVFEGPDARAAVEHLVGDAEVWQAATAWRECLAGQAARRRHRLRVAQGRARPASRSRPVDPAVTASTHGRASDCRSRARSRRQRRFEQPEAVGPRRRRAGDVGEPAGAARPRRGGRGARGGGTVRAGRRGRPPHRARRRRVRPAGAGRRRSPAAACRRSPTWLRSISRSRFARSSSSAPSCRMSRPSPASTPRSTRAFPRAAATYALPAEWRKRWNLRRYGFHGLSHAYVARRVAELAGRDVEELRTVSCHLGAGASLAAVDRGVSVDTTMGFTPLEGLVMATRSGSVDPGLVIWLEEHVGMPPSELASTLEHRSGLLGLAGVADMRAVLEAEKAGDPDAQLAVEVYLHRLRREIAGMAAAMDGLDAIAFTGGVGERSPEIRARAAAGLSFLGVALDEGVNAAAAPDAEIGRDGAPVRAFVVEAREDLQIAREVRSPARTTRLRRNAMNALSDGELQPDGRVLARGELRLDRPDLPAPEPAAARAAAARARQAAPARPLGDDAGTQLRLRAHEPRDPELGPRRDLRDGPRARRPGGGRERLPRGHVHRDLPGDHAGRGGAAAAVPAVLVPGRHPVARRAGDARLDPRGRRARLLALARVRRRVRQPGPARLLHRRRRRGGDRAARHRLALEQVPRPGHATARCCRSCT